MKLKYGNGGGLHVCSLGFPRGLCQWLYQITKCRWKISRTMDIEPKRFVVGNRGRHGTFSSVFASMYKFLGAFCRVDLNFFE